MKKSTVTLFLACFLILFSCKEEVKEQPVFEEKNKQIAPQIPAENKSKTVNPFEQNAYFEGLIAKNLQSSYKVNVDKPKINEILMTKNGKVKVEINGYYVDESENKNNILVLEIYPNAFEANGGNRPILEQKLKLTEENRYSIFRYLNYVNLSGGLYYYFLKIEDKIIYVGKFQVN